jgi:hypothetical protein
MEWGETESIEINWPVVPASDGRRRMERLVKWELAWESEVFGENILQFHFVHHKSQDPDL